MKSDHAKLQDGAFERAHKMMLGKNSDGNEGDDSWGEIQVAVAADPELQVRSFIEIHISTTILKQYRED